MISLPNLAEPCRTLPKFTDENDLYLRIICTFAVRTKPRDIKTSGYSGFFILNTTLKTAMPYYEQEMTCINPLDWFAA